MITIQALSAAHADAIAKVHSAAIAPELGWTAASICQTLETVPGAIFTGAFEHEVLLGFLELRAIEKTAEVIMLAVHPRTQRRGIARSLLQTAMHGSAYKTVMLEVAADNFGAIALYAKCGFVEDGRRPNYYKRQSDGSRQDAILMSLDLAGHDAP